jgi:hypothetical protein
MSQSARAFVYLFVVSLILFIVGVVVLFRPAGSVIRVPLWAQRPQPSVSLAGDMTTRSLNSFRVVYINLDRRTDRRTIMEAMIDQMGWLDRTDREPGVVAEFGALGCTRAHIRALERHLDRYPSLPLLVLEDDVEWVASSPEHVNQFLSSWCAPLNQRPWSVLVIAGFDTEGDAHRLDPSARRPSYEPFDSRSIFRARHTQTTSAYMVHPAYLRTLRQNFCEGEAKLRAQSHAIREWCIDIYWQKAQQTAVWYKVEPVLARQRNDYSDIEQTQVAYGI